MATTGTSWRVGRNLPLHPGINYSKTDVGGDLGGFAFAVGSVVTVLIGLPMFVPVYAASIVLGIALAVAIHAWREHTCNRRSSSADLNWRA